MRAVLLASLLSCLLGSAAGAGPWPRSPGAGFVALTAGTEEAAARRRAQVEVYGEYGFRDRLTFGAHLRRADARLRGDLFARWHPGMDGALALGLTLGARLEAGDGLPVAPLLAVHLGRGAETALGNLWARADLQVVGNRRGLRGIAEVELSGQLGLRSGWGGLAMVTLAGHRDRDGRTLKLTPALGYAVTPRSTLVLGATLLPRTRRLDGVQLSLWHDF